MQNTGNPIPSDEHSLSADWFPEFLQNPPKPLDERPGLRVSRASNKADDMAEMFESAFSELQRTLKVDRAGLLMLQRDGHFRFSSWSGLSDIYRRTIEEYTDARGAADQLEPLLIPDSQASLEPAPVLSTLLTEGIGAIGLIPLIHRGSSVGTLNICFEKSHEFTDEELNILTSAAARLATTIGRRQAECELRASEHRYRLLFERNPSGFCITSLDGKIQNCNHSFARIFGYESREEILRAGAPALYSNPDDRSDFLSRLEKEGTLNGIELLLRRKDGSPVWVLGNVSLVTGFYDRPGVIEGIWMDITERKIAEEAVRSSREILRALSAHLQSVRESERTRIAREIHDELGQILTRLKMELSFLEEELPGDSADLKARTRYMSELVDGTIRSVGRICSELRPSLLDNLGLNAALEHEINEFKSRSGIDCTFDSCLPDLLMDRDRETALFRIFQETITNISRHAEATRVEAVLSHHDGNVILEIVDNGIGITPDSIDDPSSLGLIGMRERVLQLGGTLKVTGQSKRGTRVRVTLPVPIQPFSKNI